MAYTKRYAFILEADPLSYPPGEDKIYDDRALLEETKSYANNVEEAEANLVAAKLEQTRHVFLLRVAAAVNDISAIDMANEWLCQIRKKPVIAAVKHAIVKCQKDFKGRINIIFHPSDTRVEEWRVCAQDPSKLSWNVQLEAHVSQEFNTFKDEVLKLAPDFDEPDAKFVTKHIRYFNGCQHWVDSARKRLVLWEKNKKHKTGEVYVP